jgi:uncharacterized protein
MKRNQVWRLGFWTALAAVPTFVFLCGAALAASASAVVGDWEGALDTGNGTLRVVFHISQGPEDSFTGTLDSPDQGVTGIAVTSITFKQPDLHLEVEKFRCSYDGKIGKDSTEIIGQWKQGNASLALTMKRVR